MMQSIRIVCFCLIFTCIMGSPFDFISRPAIGASSLYDANLRFLGFVAAWWNDTAGGINARYLLIYDPGGNHYMIIDAATGYLAEEQYIYYEGFGCSGQAYIMTQRYPGTILKSGSAYYEVLGGSSTTYIRSYSFNNAGSLTCTNIPQMTSVNYRLSPLRRTFSPTNFSFPVSLPLRIE